MAKEKIPEHTERANTYCRNAKTEARQYELLDGKVPGLELRVNSKGKEWSLRYRVKIGEKWGNKRLPLGDFPTITVAAARSEALKAKARISQGEDPMGERQAEADRRAQEIKARKLEEESRKSVASYFEDWIVSDKPAGRKDGGKELRRIFEKDVLPLIGHIDIKDVTKAHIKSVTDAVLKRKANRLAQSLFSDMRQFFDEAILDEHITENPTAQIKKKTVGKKAKPRDRVLSLREIRLLDQKMRASSLNRVTQIIYMLQIALVCRINELCQASWSEIDWSAREWTIQAGRTKSDRSITLSLPIYSINLLRELQTLTGHTRWLYPGQDESKPINRKAATNHARDRQLPEGQKPTNGRTVETRSLVVGNAVWKTHDLRRSGATIMQMLGVPTEVSEKCLNHVDDDDTKNAYHQYGYDREMKRAWHLLNEALSVVTGPDGEAFLTEYDKDRQLEPDEEQGLLVLVKKYYKKPDERQDPA